MTPPTTRAVPVPFTNVWLDISPTTTVLICTACGDQFGPFMTDMASDIKHAAQSHWSKHHKGIQGFTPEEANRYAPCTADDDCGNKVISRGLCMKHYQQKRRAAMKEAA